MQEKREYKIGDQIESKCETCQLMRRQLVVMVGIKNQVTATTCPGCGNKNRYRRNSLPAEKPDDGYTPVGKPYHPAQKYEKGEFIQHSSFGCGEVVAVLEARKIEVLFDDRLRCLVHERNLESH